MRKVLKSVLVLSLFAGVLYSCNSNDAVVEKTPEAVNYSSLKIGNLTAGEIGKLHNSSLQVLKNNGTMKGSVTQIISTLQKSDFDNRISDNDIQNSLNDLYQTKLFTKNLTSPLSKKENIDNFQEDALNFLISKNEISQDAKTEINNLSTLDISSMKLKTNELLVSTQFTSKEKEYFAVYTSIYENSNQFWSANHLTARVAPYAADAIGGILGLYGGPVWSIIQGAACSAAFD